MKFKDKVCVITGGALGIGRCLTREFAKAGAKVAFIDMDKKASTENADYISKKGGTALFFCGDIAEEKVLEAFRDDVVERFGNIDYLINNACISRRGILSKCSYTVEMTAGSTKNRKIL